MIPLHLECGLSLKNITASRWNIDEPKCLPVRRPNNNNASVASAASENNKEEKEMLLTEDVVNDSENVTDTHTDDYLTKNDQISFEIWFEPKGWSNTNEHNRIQPTIWGIS